MASDEKWYFTKEQLLQSPSRKSGYDVDKELSCRQQAANFIQDMGQRLQVSQLCINTAIVYMHRFYVFHSLASFHRNAIAAAALFLAAKVEEQPRKLEHVIKVAHICLHRESPNLDTKSEVYLEQAQDLVFNENVLLQTLGFDVAIDHPHTHVVRCCHLVRASKDLAQTSYFMASNSLHLTTMCLQYKPTVVACFCIHLACKWSNWEIPRSNEGKDWFWYVDKTVTLELLEQLTGEFLAIFDKCPTKLKRKMMSMNQNNTSGFPQPSIPHDGLQFVSNFEEPRKLSGTEGVKAPEGLFPVQKQNSQLPTDKPSTSSSSSSLASHPHHQKIDYREYREKKERERLEREKQQHHHHPQQQRDGHSNVSSNSHHHSKGAPLPTKGPSGAQSRSSTSSISHKSYQQQAHTQQNIHFQNAKDNVDGNSGQNFHLSRDSKDNNYLKQHPPHSERDNNKDHHGQFSQSGNVQHQNYPHKPESSYTHRDGTRSNHANQLSGSSNLSQSHHSQSHSSSNQTLLVNPREFGTAAQREGASTKDNETQSQSSKKDMSSSIRDIIGQTLPQVDSHSMTNERKDVRDKNRSNYMYGNMSSNNRPEVLKNGREQGGKIFHDSSDKKLEEFGSRTKERVYKKEEDEPVIDAIKIEPITPIKVEKCDESETAENYVGSGSGGVNNWSYDFGFNLSNVKSEKKDLSGTSKTDSTLVKTEMVVDKNESAKSDIFAASAEANSSKSQAVHPVRGVYDSKYKGHHYPCGNKSSDISQFKNDKPSAQSSSDITKKFNDRLHDKLRKIEVDRVSHMPEAVPPGELLKHHKLSKEIHEKQKVLIPGQQHMDQKLKERSSPSKYTKMKTISRPCNLDYVKSEPGHFSLGPTVDNSSAEGDRNEKSILGSHKVTAGEDSSKGVSNLNNFHKQQKNQEFGSVGGLTGSLADSNLIKGAKTCSIFSPDSKIPPQNILSSLEKDSKKNVPMSHRTLSSKSSPTSLIVNVKGNVPTSVSMNAAVSSTGSTGSLFSPPLPKTSQITVARHRTSSSGSEPELIPVVTKIEDTPGYENVIREKKAVMPVSDKIVDKSVVGERTENTSLFDFDLKSTSKNKSADAKTNMGRSESSQFGAAKQSTSVKLPSEIRSDLGAVIYASNPKPVSVSKPGQTFSLSEPKLSLANSISTVNLSGIEKMVDTSISPAKQSIPYGASSSLKPNLGMNINFNLPVTSVSNTFGSAASGQVAESAEKLSTDQNASKNNSMLVNQEIIDVEDISHSDSKKRSEKKKKKDKHKHKDKDRSERKKEKKKHKEKDKDRIKDKDKHRDKERPKEKEKHSREKEIDVVNSEIVNSEAPIKITIPKDKISGGLKIKISKDCLKKEGEVDSPKSGTSGELKLKISKDKFSHMSTYKEESKGSSKKRERSPKSSSDLPYPKFLKTSDKKISSSSRSNGTDGSSRNLSSHRHSVSENGSHIDISSLYDFPFDFEENGEGIIKTPDYDFEALNSSEFPQSINNTLPEEIDGLVKNSQNECERLDFHVHPNELHAIESYTEDIGRSDADVSCMEPVLNPFPAPDPCSKPSNYLKLGEDARIPETTPAVGSGNGSSPSKICSTDVNERESSNKGGSVPGKAPDDYVLKNYKSILDSHSKKCVEQSEKANVVEEESVRECSSTANDPVVKNVRKTPDAEVENPNYYNKYFKKEGNNRTWLNEEKKTAKNRIEEKPRSEDRPRVHDKFDRYRNDYSERNRHYREAREYCADPQYYFEGNDSRRFDYQKYLPNHFFNLNKTENEVAALNYDINANENASVYQHSKTTPQFVCDSSISNNTLDVNLQYHYGYYNSYMYGNGGYRFYGNVPFVNMSLINQQPTPPGTVETSVHLGPPPLPLEPPPDLPPPPETPPPKQISGGVKSVDIGRTDLINKFSQSQSSHQN